MFVANRAAAFSDVLVATATRLSQLLRSIYALSSKFSHLLSVPVTVDYNEQHPCCETTAFATWMMKQCDLKEKPMIRAVLTVSAAPVALAAAREMCCLGWNDRAAEELGL